VLEGEYNLLLSGMSLILILEGMMSVLRYDITYRMKNCLGKISLQIMQFLKSELYIYIYE
jgi:hypothetical protein